MGKNGKSAGRGASASVDDKVRFGPGPTRAEYLEAGKALRDKCPRSSHADWTPSEHRRDAVELMESSDEGRIPDLIPIRHGRMLRSPFTFYRGAALNMAADLSETQVTGIRVQSLWRRSPVQFRCVCHPRTTRRVRHQRPG